MKVYIAGRIKGDPFARRKFGIVQSALEVNGDTILNPTVLPQAGLTIAGYMRICFAMIDVADCVVFLWDWKDSGGAKLEKDYCDYTGKPYKIMEKEEKS